MVSSLVVNPVCYDGVMAIVHYFCSATTLVPTLSSSQALLSTLKNVVLILDLLRRHPSPSVRLPHSLQSAFEACEPLQHLYALGGYSVGFFPGEQAESTTFTRDPSSPLSDAHWVIEFSQLVLSRLSPTAPLEPASLKYLQDKTKVLEVISQANTKFCLSAKFLACSVELRNTLSTKSAKSTASTWGRVSEMVTELSRTNYATAPGPVDDDAMQAARAAALQALVPMQRAFSLAPESFLPSSPALLISTFLPELANILFNPEESSNLNPPSKENVAPSNVHPGRVVRFSERTVSSPTLTLTAVGTPILNTPVVASVPADVSVTSSLSGESVFNLEQTLLSPNLLASVTLGPSTRVSSPVGSSVQDVMRKRTREVFEGRGEASAGDVRNLLMQCASFAEVSAQNKSPEPEDVAMAACDVLDQVSGWVKGFHSEQGGRMLEQRYLQSRGHPVDLSERSFSNHRDAVKQIRSEVLGVVAEAALGVLVAKKAGERERVLVKTPLNKRPVAGSVTPAVGGGGMAMFQTPVAKFEEDMGAYCPVTTSAGPLKKRRTNRNSVEGAEAVGAEVV